MRPRCDKTLDGRQCLHNLNHRGSHAAPITDGDNRFTGYLARWIYPLLAHDRQPYEDQPYEDLS